MTFIKKIWYGVVFFCLGGVIFSQHRNFMYEHVYIPDSTQKVNTISEVMVLSVDEKKSEYYSYERYVSDSTIAADRKKGILDTYSKKKNNPDRVIKYTGTKNVKWATPVSADWYLVNDQRTMQWVLFPEFSKIQGLKVQKATTGFAGRQWTAWFTKDIPIQDGPYKFRGLPGLILAIEDKGRNHSFELKGIQNVNTDFVYPDETSYHFIEISQPQYVKLYRDFRENPVARWIGIMGDQINASGKKRTAQEVLRDMEIMEKERLKKDNNPIELDLLP
ncbi:MAG: GLPGLI family protein [Chryseobacterium sp.]|uniref:GLPGLI family protein n=1 Tax=Chryseobacterium sp. TaxID=1871047 RepID=UPI0025C68194|nr:GLPGLI family protein [Chryseobacterium sp.]MCJ7932607.1 GLPGLI family protein [Chryseobacterium sp.]